MHRFNYASLLFILIVITGFACTAPTPAPAAQEPLDGPNKILRDALLDNLIGRWRTNGMMGNEKIEHDLSAEWVLNHQFVRLHFQDLHRPKEGDVAYEAAAHIGYDNMSERYVAHWMDVFGGRWSTTLGYGKKSGEAIKFVFEYPDGPFHTTFTWQPKEKTWRILMEQKDKSGKWGKFAEQTARRVDLK